MNIDPTKLINGNVLIKLQVLNDKIRLSNGAELWIDRFFNEMQHTDIVADVVAVPDPPICHYTDITNKKHFAPIEVISGDRVYLFYLGVQNALQMKRQNRIVNNPEGRLISDNGELYILLHYYDNFFMAIRNEEVIMLNDYVLVEPTYRELEALKLKSGVSGLEVPESKISEMKKNTQYGIIRYIGRNLSNEADKAYFSDEELKPGVEVLFSKNADIPLEYDLHKTFEKDKTLFRIHRRNIEMIL